MKLFIPGPVSVREDVLAKMSEEMISHRGEEASFYQREISEMMKTIFGTVNEVLLSTSSGSGLMEGAIRSCTAKKAACFSVGAFGKKWYNMGVDNGVPADFFEVEPGENITPAMVEEALSTGEYDLVTLTNNETSTGISNPTAEIAEVVKKYPEVVFCLDAVSSAGGVKLEVDKWGVDICITSTQKCLGLPPGLAACTFSEKALKRTDEVKNRGTYFDLKKLHKFNQEKSQYPSTPSVSHMFAMKYQLDYILKEEGLENRIKRHREMADIVRAWAKKNFALLPINEECASDTVTCIVNTRDVDIKSLVSALKKKDMLIGNGYGDLKDKTFRIAHMADTSIEDIKTLLSAIDEELGL